MDNELIIKMSAIMIDCKDPNELANFYAALVKWEVVFFDEEYAVIAPPDTSQGTYPSITFQHNPNYTPPTWTDEPNAHQQMAHIDFCVNDLEKAVEYAISCGATIASKQFSDRWKVMFDPEGHPFCLVLQKGLIESEGFALR